MSLLPPPRFITTAPEWTRFLGEIGDAPLLALDTEAASFHRFHDRIFLVQISSRSLTAVIDPLAVPGLPGLAPLLGSPEIEWILHDADYDLRLLRREYGWTVSRLFDTRIAAQFLNEPGIGLAALLERWLGISTDKKFQRADWSERPLSQPMIDYAATDTHYLPALRDHLRGQLEQRGRLGWAEEEFDLSRAVQWTPDDSPEMAFLSMKGARTLDRRGLALLRELHGWRDQVASGLDRARFRVMSNEALLALARTGPTSIEELRQVSGVGRDLIERRGVELLAAIARGQEVPQQDLPRFPRMTRITRDPNYDARLERLKATRNQLAVENDLPPGVLCPNGILESIAREQPLELDRLAVVPGVRRWQVQVLGPALLGAIPEPPPA